MGQREAALSGFGEEGFSRQKEPHDKGLLNEHAAVRISREKQRIQSGIGKGNSDGGLRYAMLKNIN